MNSPRGPLHLAVLVALVGAAAFWCVPTHALDENPKDIIAAHIRMQGFACDKPLSAERDRGASKPNETVWILKCENRAYQVRLVPDMAAAVRPLD